MKLSTVFKVIVYVLVFAAVAYAVYHFWPLFFLLLGGSELKDSATYMAYEHRREMEKERGVVYTNSEDPWSKAL